MKKLFTFESFEKLIQIIAICITAIAMLSILESCGSEYVNCKSLTENRNVLPLHALNIAGEKDLNIVFLPEGYTVDQMDDFVAEVNVAWGILRQTKPYCHSLDRINVYYSTAMASATDSLGSGHTVFALGTPKPLRASCEISLDSIINVTKRLPFDADKTVLVIMVNVGGNIQLGFTILSKPEPKMLLPETVVIRSLFYRYPAAFTHEMGHAIGLLADEYYYNGDNFVFNEKECEEMLSWQKYGAYLNVSTSSNESEVFWSQFIIDEDFAEEHIGIYEGGQTFPMGVYRSTFNSVMRYYFECDFYNAVDRYLIYHRIEKIHSGRDISYEEWKQTDLMYPQAPINWHDLTGGITRSSENVSDRDCICSGSDVVIIHDYIFYSEIFSQ